MCFPNKWQRHGIRSLVKVYRRLLYLICGGGSEAGYRAALSRLRSRVRSPSTPPDPKLPTPELSRPKAAFSLPLNMVRVWLEWSKACQKLVTCCHLQRPEILPTGANHADNAEYAENAKPLQTLCLRLNAVLSVGCVFGGDGRQRFRQTPMFIDYSTLVTYHVT